MIQILNNFSNDSTNNTNISSKCYNTNFSKKNNYNKFKFIFIFSIIICIFLIIIYIISIYLNIKNEKLSKSLINNFSITTLYSNSVDYSAFKLNSNNNNNNNNNISNPFVIGLIKIDKINLTYPILSSTTDELLKISPCYFYGSMPNEIGNLCIAGHNYSNDTIFGKVDLLSVGDIIRIYDLNSNFIDYIIYSVYEVSPNNTSCLNQNTYGKREITLITCNTLKGTRLILKAKENEVS